MPSAVSHTFHSTINDNTRNMCCSITNEFTVMQVDTVHYCTLHYGN